MPNSAIYDATIVHHRRSPEHHFTYRVPYLYVDLDELDDLAPRGRRPWLLGTRHRPVTLRRADHFDGARSDGDRSDGLGSLHDAARAELERAGHPDAHLPGLHFRVLTQPRVLGYGFNPVSFWWALRPDGTTAAVLAEINNTFGERVTQVLTGASEPDADDDGVLVDHRDKQLHVSPFLAPDLTYHYRLPHTPGDRLLIRIDACDDDGPVLAASLHGRRRPLDDPHLLEMIAALGPQRTMWSIHAQALALWRRHAPFRHKPPFVPGIGSVPDNSSQEAA